LLTQLELTFGLLRITFTGSDEAPVLRSWWQTTRTLLFVFAVIFPGTALQAEQLHIPHVSTPPKLEDFEDMVPTGAALQLQQIATFTQSYPYDGKPPSQKTHAFLGYDDNNLYVVLTCFDKNPRNIRAQMSRREPSTPFDADDYIELTLDTFHDQRHALVFDINPLGIQADALYTEGQGTDYSWDTLWYTRSRINTQGYVIWTSIPFRSLRFHSRDVNGWGITISRYIARENETDYWPVVSDKISGRLTQEATISGFEGISPGRNMQFIPYVEGRSFRALDTRDPADPRFSTHTLDGKAGLDSKFVFHDSLVLDTTINPDFAQIESDQPQNTINQRFEVFFPEKRPFFLENSNFFEAPLIAVGLQTRMLFTRRIADPSFGTRLTGKVGAWNLGFLVADDRSPGKIVPDSDPDHGTRAYFGVGRVTHDLGKNSMIGAMYTDREFLNDFNRVGGIDGLFHINKNWNATYRGYMSSTRENNLYQFGQHHEAVLIGNGLRFTFSLQYLDITPNFRTEAGFVPRVDQRAINNYGHFYWRPAKNKLLVQHGPEENVTQMWDHRNQVIQQAGSFDYAFIFKRNIVFAPIISYESDVLRPNDFPGLPSNRQYAQDAFGIVFRGHPTRMLNWDTRVIRDGTVVVVPPAGQLPYVGDETAITQTVGIRPTGRLQIDNTYILEHVVNGAAHHAVVNNHIIRSKWNYQFNREFSLRFITQYNGLLTNPQFSSLEQQKTVNFDVLFTYFLHPGTAIYVGYNSNLENIDPGLCTRLAGSLQCDPNGNGLIRTSNGLINDGRQVFVKVSYLFRR
jgi:hypothetical protein